MPQAMPGKALPELGHPVPDFLVDLQGVGSGSLIDRDENRRFVVKSRTRCVLQGAEFDASDVTQVHNGVATRPGMDDNVAELLRVAQAAHGIDLELEFGIGRRGRLAQSPGRDLDVLLLDCLLDIRRGDAKRGELVRIEPHAHRVAPFAEDVDVADTGKSFHRIDKLQVRVVAERDQVHRSVRRVDVDTQHDVGVFLGDDDTRLIDDGRQLR